MNRITDYFTTQRAFDYFANSQTARVRDRVAPAGRPAAVAQAPTPAAAGDLTLESATPAVFGDVNGSDSFAPSDLLALLNALNQTDAGAGFNGDVNGNGTTSASDLLALVNYANAANG